MELQEFFKTLSKEKQAEINSLEYMPITSRIKDYTNSEIGDVFILGRAPNDGNRACWWGICKKCAEHTIFKIRGDRIKNLKMCPLCSQKLVKQKNKKPHKDLVGQKFGKLTVLEPYVPENGPCLWHCKCDCGNEINVSTSSLISGNTKSCGCLRKENAHFTKKATNLINMRFGNLTVIEKTDQRKYGKIVWKCKCDCGNIVYVPTGSLTSGNTRSCGCIKKSQGAQNVEQCLIQNNISYSKEYYIKELNRRFDFAIYENDQLIRLVEYDGEQHYRASGGWNTQQSLMIRRQHDKEKNEYALSHNIPLVRIPYWERDKITLDMIMGDQYLVRQ